MKTVTILLDGKKYQAEEGEPVLKVARREGVEIPFPYRTVVFKKDIGTECKS